jgi:hypothetical protein
LFQRTHYIKNSVKVAVFIEVLSNNFVAFVFVISAIQVFVFIDPAQKKDGGLGYFGAGFPHDAPDILDDFYEGCFGVDEDAHIRAFGVDAFADGFTRGDNKDVIVWCRVKEFEFFFSIIHINFGGEFNHRNLFVFAYFFWEFVVQNVVETTDKLGFVYEVNDGLISFGIYVGVKC